MPSVILKPQISIFQRLATTGPKSSKAKIGCYPFLKTSEQHFSIGSLQRVKSKRNELLLF